MSLVERFAAVVTTEPKPYRCLGCERGFDVQYHVCPECAGFRVDPTGW